MYAINYKEEKLQFSDIQIKSRRKFMKSKVNGVVKCILYVRYSGKMWANKVKQDILFNRKNTFITLNL